MRTISDEIMRRHLATDPELGAAIDAVYSKIGDRLAERQEEYHRRHMVESLCCLTVYDPQTAAELIRPIRARIIGKTVVEIGAGVGVLSIALCRYCPKVIAIEADPGWSWIFTKHLYVRKPPNLTWIFGRAEEVADWVRADVAVIATHSGQEAMARVARRIANEVIELYPRKERKE